METRPAHQSRKPSVVAALGFFFAFDSQVDSQTLRTTVYRRGIPELSEGQCCKGFLLAKHYIRHLVPSCLQTERYNSKPRSISRRLVYNIRSRFARAKGRPMQPKATPPATAPTLEQVITILVTHRDDLASRYHLRSLGVFGSYVRGEQRPESDIDVLVDFVVTPSLFTLTALEDELTALLGAPVDLAVKSALRPHIGVRILSEVVTV
jgi:uncharacterized protein